MSNASLSLQWELKGSGGSFRASCSQTIHVVIKPFLFGALFPKCLGEIILQCEEISDENVFETGTEMHTVLEFFFLSWFSG